MSQLNFEKSSKNRSLRSLKEITVLAKSLKYSFNQLKMIIIFNHSIFLYKHTTIHQTRQADYENSLISMENRFPNLPPPHHSTSKKI